MNYQSLLGDLTYRDGLLDGVGLRFVPSPIEAVARQVAALFEQQGDKIVPSDPLLHVCMIDLGGLPLMSPGMLFAYLFGEEELAHFQNRSHSTEDDNVQ
jgi:hypothetical protein